MGLGWTSQDWGDKVTDWRPCSFFFFLFLCASSHLRFHHLENGQEKTSCKKRMDKIQTLLTVHAEEGTQWVCEKIAEKLVELNVGPCKQRSLEDLVVLLYTSRAWSEHISRSLFASLNKGSEKYWWKGYYGCFHKSILLLNPWNLCSIHLLYCQTSQTDNFKSTFWNLVICSLIETTALLLFVCFALSTSTYVYIQSEEPFGLLCATNL